MILTWAPADQPARDFTWRTDELLPADFEAIEDVGRWESLEEYDRAVRASNRTAWRVALWICLRRETPGLTLDQVQPRPYDLSMRFEPEEELAIAETMLADPDVTGEDRDLLEAVVAERRAGLGKAEPPTVPAP